MVPGETIISPIGRIVEGRLCEQACSCSAQVWTLAYTLQHSRCMNVARDITCSVVRHVSVGDRLTSPKLFSCFHKCGLTRGARESAWLRLASRKCLIILSASHHERTIRLPSASQTSLQCGHLTCARAWPRLMAGLQVDVDYGSSSHAIPETCRRMATKQRRW